MSTITTQRALYRFRPGALDTIASQTGRTTERQLAALLGIDQEQLAKVRHGAIVGAPMALRVSALMGTEDYLAAWFDPVATPAAAA